MLSYKFVKSKFLWIPVLVLYAMLHLAKLELYPLCLFGMYSLPLEEVVEEYSLFIVKINGEELDYKNMPYKKFLMINNTLRKYGAMIENEHVDPSVFTLRKTMERIPGSFLDLSLEKPYHYSDPEQKLLDWLHRFLDLEKTDLITVAKQDYILLTDRHYSIIGSNIIAGE